NDTRIDELRERMEASEDTGFTQDYDNPEKRSIANALTVTVTDGTVLDEVVVEYPSGHKRRREEGMPVLVEKYRTNLARVFPAKQQRLIAELSLDFDALSATPVHAFVDLMVTP